MVLRPRHRNLIIATCVSGVFLTILISTLAGCIYRFNKKSVARRAREAERSAAQAVLRAERHRRRGLGLPEAEVVPFNSKLQGPVLGNVVIKDANEFKKLRHELIEVDMSTVCINESDGGSAAATAASASTHHSTAATSAAAAYAARDELTEAFVDVGNASASTSRHALPCCNFHLNEACGDDDGAKVTPGRSLCAGGFVIVVCGYSIGGDAAVNDEGTNVSAAVSPSVASARDALVEPIAEGNAAVSNGPTIQLYRHQPSWSLYGESRYVTESDVARAPN
jgi:hypothetical protein